ncbi:unnamed protein product [Coffea canephora]|uniref:Uncharacterized protein n=1 Tax=Coffea canephora TaxID=49390 RepID=A0A068UUR9_COFCA|nr:unnamed protein product [Coffea canephora]
MNNGNCASTAFFFLFYCPCFFVRQRELSHTHCSSFSPSIFLFFSLILLIIFYLVLCSLFFLLVERLNIYFDSRFKGNASFSTSQSKPKFWPFSIVQFWKVPLKNASTI